MDLAFDQKLRQLHEDAPKKGLWKGSAAARQRSEYWTAGVEAYFDATGNTPAPHLAERPISSREALRSYDPDPFALVDETMAFKEHVEWRFQSRPETRPAE